MTFDYKDKAQRDYMDSMTFEEYCRKLDVPDRITHTIMDSLLEMAYFDKVQSASAVTWPIFSIDFRLGRRHENQFIRPSC